MSGLADAGKPRQFFDQLAQRLIRFAEHALSLRDLGALEEVSLVLMNLPVANARQIGQYYHALFINRNGQKYEALSLLETVADKAPLHYRARAIQSMGGVHHELGHFEESLRFFPDAMRAISSQDCCDPLTTLLIHLELTCIKSEMGDHLGALADYDRLAPIVRMVSRKNPLYFFFYHNELAVEFSELGRLAEAQAACAIAIASPFAGAYPEWSATRNEIEAKRKSDSSSVVAINRAPETHSAAKADTQRNPNRIVAFVISPSPNGKYSFQRSVFKSPEKKLTVLTAVSIPGRMLNSIGPRVPPI